MVLVGIITTNREIAMIDYNFRSIQDQRCSACLHVRLNTGYDIPKHKRNWRCELHSNINFTLDQYGLYGMDADDSTCNDWAGR